MKKRIGIAGMAVALAVGAQAAVTIDFTNTTEGNNAASYTYENYDLFGDGSLTVDITVTNMADANTLDKIAHGWGLNGGSGRLDTGEQLSFIISDLQGSAATAVTGFEFVGLVCSVQDGTIVWNQTAADVIDVNGVTLTTYDAAQSDPIPMAYTAIAPYDLEGDFATAGDDAAALTISTNGTFLIEQIADSGRIAGFQLNVLSENNLPPVAQDQSVTTEFETSIEITLTGSDPDTGPSNLTYSVAMQPTSGTLSGATNVWIYTPTNGFSGADSFTFTVNDGATNSAPATVSITVEEEPAAVVEGTVIGIDFGGDTTPDPENWNTLNSPGVDIAIGSLTDTNGNVLAGVAFNTVITGTGNGGQNDAPSISLAYPSIPDNAQEDWWYEYSADGVFSFEFSGLDTNLTYDLVIGAYRPDAVDAQIENGATAWVAGGTTNTTVVITAVDSYVSFTGLTTSDGVLTINSANNGLNTVGSVSALTLTAAGSIAPPIPTISASISAESLIISWDSGGTFDVMTNANLVYPIWGVATNSASPVTNAIGSEAQLFYKLNYISE